MSIDNDLLAGVAAAWAAAGLAESVGPLYTDDVPAGVAGGGKVYARAEAAVKRREYQAPVLSGDPYLAVCRLAVTVVGYHRGAVGDLLDARVKPLLAAAFPVPNSEVRTAHPPFDGPGETVTQDPATKAGERPYRGTLEYDVWLVRLTP